MRARVVASLMLVSSMAVAQVPATKAAEETFAKGRDLMKVKKYAEACEAFEQSQRLDPQYGTQYNLAVCYELAGKLASAWNLFRLLGRSDDKPDRRQAEVDEAKALADRVPRIAIAFDGKPVGATLTMNGTDALALVGVQTPVDLGTIKLVATAPGYQTWHRTVNVKDERATVDVPVHLYKTGEKAPPETLTDDGAAPSGGTGKVEDGGTTGGAVAVPPPPVVVHDEQPGAWKRGTGKIALIAGGGVTALGLGFGGLAWSEWSKAKTTASSNASGANSQVHTARQYGDVSTVCVTVGLASAAAGVFLLLTAPNAEEHHDVTFVPTASPDAAGFAVTGRF